MRKDKNNLQEVESETSVKTDDINKVLKRMLITKKGATIKVVKKTATHVSGCGWVLSDKLIADNLTIK